MCSLYYSLIHLGLQFLVTYMKISSAANACSERSAVCFGKRLQNYQPAFSHLFYRGDSTKLSTLEESMNSFSGKLVALQQ